VDDTVPVPVPEAGAAGVVDADSAAPPPAAPQVLPSERLTRLAELAATELTESVIDGEAAGPQVLSDQALKDVLVAVDASTVTNTKKAYRSDWHRFTRWAGAGGYPVCRRPRWWSRTT